MIKKNYFYRLFPLLLLIFIDSFSYFVVIPVLLKIYFHARYDLLPLSASLKTRESITGITISLAMFSALLFAPIIGQASDKYGRKKILLLCISCVGLGFLFPIIGILKKNIAWIFAGRFIAGIGSASQPVAQATVADVCHNNHKENQKNQKAVYLGLIAFMMTLALIIGPLAGGFLSDTHLLYAFTVTTPFECAFFLSVINFLLILFFFRETKSTKEKIITISVKKIFSGLPQLIKQYRLGTLILLFFTLELAWSQYYQSIPLFLQLTAHFSAEKISVFNAVMGIVMACSLLFLYPLLLRFISIQQLLRWSLLITLLGLAVCALFSSTLCQWIFSACIALGTGFSYVSLVTLISNRTDVNYQGLAMGYLSTLLYCAWMMTAFASGFLISVHPQLPFILAAVCFGIPYVIYSVLK